MTKTDIREMRLKIWEEIIGCCVRFEVKRDQVAVILRACGQNVQIAYERNSKEEIILRRFGRKPIGRKVGILRTDIPSKPIVVRIIPKKKSASSEGTWWSGIDRFIA